MKNVKKIMVAFDRSEFSKQALRYACELADDLKADLIVTNVINQRDVDIAKWSELSSLIGILAEKFIDQQKKSDPMKFKKKLELHHAATFQPKPYLGSVCRFIN